MAYSEAYSGKCVASGLSYGGIRTYVYATSSAVNGNTYNINCGGSLCDIKCSGYSVYSDVYCNGTQVWSASGTTANTSGDWGWRLNSGGHDVTLPRKHSDYSVEVYCYGSISGGTTFANVWMTIPAAEHHTYAFDANGGTGAPGSITKWYGEKLSIPSTVPTRANYRFDGWSETKGGTAQYQPGQSYWTNDSDKTLYACWTLLYKAPTVNYAKGLRVASATSTAEATMGEYVRCQFDWSVDTSIYADNTGASFAATATITAADGTATTATPTLSPTAPSGTSGTVYAVVACPTGSTASVTVTVTDSCEKAGSTSATGSVGTAHPPLEFANSGTSVGLLNSAPASGGISLGGLTLTGANDIAETSLVTFPMSTLALMLQPRAWRFGANGSGSYTWGSTGWHSMTSIFTYLNAGADNWSQFFSKSGATLTTKVQGTWKFTLTILVYSSARCGCGVFSSSGNELSSNFARCGGSQASCTCTTVMRLDAGATRVFREYNDNTDAKKYASSNLESLIVEYLGPDPS